MAELCHRRVHGFSTGALLAPRGWTLDVAPHYTVHSSLSSQSAAAPASSPSDGSLADALPPGSSSNTARFECMLGAQQGSSLYVTELYVPRHEPAATTAAVSAAPLVFSWTADRVQRVLQASSAVVHSTVTAAGEASSGAAACVLTRVVEVTSSQQDTCQAAAEQTSDMGEATVSTSILAAVEPFFHLFVEVVWVAGDRLGPCGTLEPLVDQLLEDLVRQYKTPALQLDAYRCFSHAAPENGLPSALPPSLTAMDTNRSAAAASLQPPQREPCAPNALADLRPSQLCSVWGTCLYSAATRAFVQFLTPAASFAVTTGTSFLCSQCAWQQSTGAQVPTPDTYNDAESPAGPEVSQLLKDVLHLQWEGLSACTAVVAPSRPEGSSESASGGAATETITVAVASLPLDEVAAPTSLYSYRSLELAWEAHAVEALASVCECRATGTRRREAAEQQPRHPVRCKSWVLTKVSQHSSFCTVELDSAVEQAELQHLRMEDPALTAAEKTIRHVEQQLGKQLVAPRSSTYLLRLAGCRAISASLPQSKEAAVCEATADALYLLQLHAPRVHSRHAVVVCMAVPPAWVPARCAAAEAAERREGDGAAAGSRPSFLHDAASRWAAALSSVYRIAPLAPSLWLPRDAQASSSGSGVCARSGRLVLRAPAAAGEARYQGLHLCPVACNAFTTLGSIAAWVQRPRHGDPSGASAESTPLSLPSDTYAAVWTLLGDGRSAATYLDDALMEYMYDTGSKNLSNVSQPSQHVRQPGVLVIRKRQRRKAKATASVLAGMHEVCSAWVDIGATRRLFLQARDVGVGEVLVLEASLIGPHAEPKTKVAAGETDVSAAEEEALEAWAGGIVASAVPKNTH